MIGKEVYLDKELTRKRFLQAAGTGVAGVALLGVAGCESGDERTRGASQRRTTASNRPEARDFRSRPDLRPPTIEVTTPARDTAPGYIFVVPDRGPGQYGPMIFDDRGQPVWFHHSQQKLVRDFRVQRYKGEPVLTWWEGEVRGTRGVGEYVILDSSYREVARFQAGNGYSGDLHEFLITPGDTALLTAYNPVSEDLSAVGGPANGTVLEGIAQEVEVGTGEVLFEWRSLEHVGVEESYLGPPDDPAREFDYFHINSVEVDDDDNFLVSARNTWTVYKIERGSGEVMWRLGGKKSDFDMGPSTEIAYQHDARRQRDGTITIFDNGAAPEVHERSRGIVLDLDTEEMKATLTREYTYPGEDLLAGFLGNAQVLPNGNVFIGWGSEPYFSEFGRDGELLFDARFPPDYTSYRSYRLEWSGDPVDKPAVKAERASGDGITVHVSWNGATEVADWEVLAGPGPDRLQSVASAPRDGFETAIAAHTAGPYVAARARNRFGQSLGTSEAAKPGR